MANLYLQLSNRSDLNFRKYKNEMVQSHLSLQMLFFQYWCHMSKGLVMYAEEIALDDMAENKTGVEAVLY